MADDPYKKPRWLKPTLESYWHSGKYPLLTALIVGEAEGETAAGMFAVGCVVRTRVRMPSWWGTDWNTIILQPHQFSCFWSDFGKRHKRMRQALEAPQLFPECAQAAIMVLDGEPDITADATHYFNPAVVLPSWANHLIKTARIGHHDFYREG
jgi:spore germination cell wall hydrolase CwlJ-like protein